MVRSVLKSSPKTKPSSGRVGSFLKGPNRFRQPILFVVIGLCITAGTILIYASLAATTPVVSDNIEFWRPRIMYCESGGRPTASNGSGHYGLYQYDVRTWKGAVGAELAAKYPLPSDAPVDVQNQAFANTWARRGSQPWNASYKCWATPELKSRVIPVIPISLPAVTKKETPAPPKSAYNTTVQGRVYIDGVLTPNISLATCVDGVIAKTDAGGIFRFELPAGKQYCVRVIDGLPAGAAATRLDNNSEHQADKSYEQQIAAKNYYHNIWQVFTPYYTWDRDSDEGFDFYFVTK